MAHIEYIEDTKPVDIVLAVKHLGSGLEIAETLDLMNCLKHDYRGTVPIEIRNTSDYEHAIGFANAKIWNDVTAVHKRKKLKRALREVCAYACTQCRAITAHIDLDADIDITVHVAYSYTDKVGRELLRERELWNMLEDEPDKIKDLTNLEIRALAELYDYKCFVAEMSDDYSMTLRERATAQTTFEPAAKIARERGLI